MEENEDEPDDVRFATSVEDEIRKGQEDEPVEESPKVPKRKVSDDGIKKRKKLEEDGCCDKKKKMKREKESKSRTVYVFEKECNVKKSNTVPRHCLSKKEHLVMLATPSRKCPPQCIKKPVIRKLKPIPPRIEELAKPTRQRILGTIEDRGDSIPPELLWNLIKMIEDKSSLTPEQAAQLFCDKKSRSTKKFKKKKRKIKCNLKERRERGKENENDLSLDPEAVCCQYLMAEKFVKSILNWKCPIPREEYQDIAEVILKRLSFILEYTPIDNADRKSQQMRFLADIISCWISGVLLEVAETHKKELEEECERRKQEKEEETDEDEDESEREDSILTQESDEESEEDEDYEDEPEKKEMKEKGVQKDEVSKGKKSKAKESATQTSKPESDEKETEADLEDVEEESDQSKGIVETERQKIERAEKKRLEEEEAERSRKEAIERRQKEKDPEQIRVEEEAEQKRIEEEAEQKRIEEEAEQKRIEEEAEQKRIEEEAEQKRMEEEAEQKRIEEEAEQKRMEEEAEQKRMEEEAEEKRKEEEAEQKRIEEEAEKEGSKVDEEKVRKEVGFDTTKDSEEETFQTASPVDEVDLEPPGQSTPIEEGPPIKVFQTDLPFVTFIGIFNTIYKMIESEPENIGQDLTTNRLHRSVYEKFHDAVKLENPALLTDIAKDVIDVVSGKIAIWLSKTLSESQILLLNKYPPEVESNEVRDWSKWLNYTTRTAGDWTLWLQNLIKEAQKMQDDEVTRGQWHEWTKKLDKNAALWRKFHLDTVHQAHHNAMMIKNREVVKTGQKKIPEEEPIIKVINF